MMKRLACVLALALAGCASTKSGNGVADAATAPLSDLNLVRAEIPPALAEALKGPSRRRPAAAGEAIAAEVGQLEAVLGADLDVPPSAARPSLIERGGHAAGEAAVALCAAPPKASSRSAAGCASSPARSATRAEVAAAIAAAGRRSYLKGVGRARGCSMRRGAGPRRNDPARPASAAQS